MRKLLIALFAACMSFAYVAGTMAAEDMKKSETKKDEKKKDKKDEKK